MDGDDMLARCVEQSFVVPVGMFFLKSTGDVVVIAKPHDSHRQQKRILIASWISNGFYLKQKDTNNPLKDTAMAQRQDERTCLEKPRTLCSMSDATVT